MARNKIQGAGLLAGPIQSQAYVPLPYDKVFEMNRYRQAEYDKNQKNILEFQKSLYNTAANVPPGMQDEALEQVQPFLNSIGQQIDAAGGDLAKVNTGNIMGQFYKSLASGELGHLSRAGAQYQAAQKDISDNTELFMKGKGGYEPGVGTAALSQASKNYQEQYDAYLQDPLNNPLPKFTTPDIYPFVDVAKKSREIVKEMDPTKIAALTNQIFAGYNNKGEAVYQTLNNKGKVIQESTTLSPEQIRKVSNVALQTDEQVQAYYNNRYMLSGTKAPENFDPATYEYTADAKTNEGLQNQYSEQYQNYVNAYAPLGTTDPQQLAQANQAATEATYRDVWKDQRMNNIGVASGNIFRQSETAYTGVPDSAELTGTPLSAEDQIPYLVGDSPFLPIDKSTSETVGSEILNLDAQISEQEALLDATDSGTVEYSTHELGLNDLKTRRNDLLVAAGEKSKAMIEDKAAKSIWWSDDTFSKSMQSYYKNIKKVKSNKGALKGVNQEQFNKKAQILSAIPGLTSIDLLPTTADQIEQLKKLTPENYGILSEAFKEGESIMPYLQAAQWIQRKARRADVLETYETSLRPVKGYGKNSYTTRLTDNLTEMMHSGDVAYTDFYANEDVKAEPLKDKRPIETMRLTPTLTMLHGAPAYKFDLYEYNKISGTADIEVGGIEETKFVKGTNSKDEMIRYQDLGIQLLTLAKESEGTAASGAYYKDGSQVLANSFVLSPAQLTGIETADMTTNTADSKGNPYIERDMSGFNIIIRRTDKPGNLSIFEFRVKSGEHEGKLVGYDDQYGRQAIRGASLEDLAYKYFMQSGEKLDTSGNTGADIVNSYYNK
jgi:hypothetical protein